MRSGVWRTAAALLLVLTGAGETVQGQGAPACARADFEAVVNEAGAALRDLNRQNTPAFQTKLRQLKEKRGWTDDQFLKAAEPFVRDADILAYDRKSEQLLNRITEVETFERFLHRTFPGKTRFSIEGLDMMIPILDEIISDAAANGVQQVMIAMAHRGRLNVLAHVLQKPYAQVLAEFKDPLYARSGRIDLGWMGDVKYHAGARHEVRPDGQPQSLTISMPMQVRPK